MPPSRVDLSQAAQADLDSIWSYVAETGGLNAASVVIDRILDRLALLKDYPQLGRERPEYGAGRRIVTSRPYVVLYRADESGVLILRIVHGARDLGVIFAEEP